jgi:glycosyltransferase involved in cell wall biosynthesis
MSIYHFAENISLERGGVRTVLVNLDNYLNTNNPNSSIILTNAKEKNDPYLEFPSTKFKAWAYSKELNEYTKNIPNENAVFHLQGVFMHCHYLASKEAQKSGIPYIVTSHGMIEPVYLKEKRLKKKFYMNLFLNKILSKSNVLHAITPQEKNNLFQLTNHKNIVEIPNFIHHSGLPKDLIYQPEEEYLLFLSRLHPQKGLDILIEAMTKIDDKKIKLKIVGTKNDYSNELQKKLNNSIIKNRIEFLGGVFGNEKYNIYANAKAFIAPSYSEAIGMVNLEAAACNTPVITTFSTGISPEWNKNGGIMINPQIDELISAINQSTSLSIEERNERGKKLSDFVINNYSWEKKGYLWDNLYDSLI